MARASGLTQTALSRVWRAFELQPHRQETLKLSTDPQFVAKTRDIVASTSEVVYANALVSFKERVWSGRDRLMHDWKAGEELGTWELQLSRSWLSAGPMTSFPP